MNEDCEDVRLDRAFMALADPVRCRIVARISRSAATVNELAEPFDISKQGVSRHIGVLEQAGLVTRTRDAQRRPGHLNPARLEELTAWIDQYRLTQERQYRQLDALLMRSRIPGSRPTPTTQSSPSTPHDDADQQDSNTTSTNTRNSKKSSRRSVRNQSTKGKSS